MARFRSDRQRKKVMMEMRQRGAGAGAKAVAQGFQAIGKIAMQAFGWVWGAIPKP